MKNKINVSVRCKTVSNES